MSLTRKPKKQSADNFISGAENSGSAKTVQTEIFPWEEPGVREDVLKTFVLRLPEPEWLKLKYIAANTPDSMQAFCLKHVLKAIDKQLDDMI
jgi:hypothetical protein